VNGDIDTHVATVMHGIDDSMMAKFSDRLTDAEIAAVITFQRNAFGNGTGDTLQPSHIKSLRAGQARIAPKSVAAMPTLNISQGVN